MAPVTGAMRGAPVPVEVRERVAVEQDDGVGAVVLAGASERTFSAGADIVCFAPSVRRGQAVALREFVRRGQRRMARIESFLG